MKNQEYNYLLSSEAQISVFVCNVFIFFFHTTLDSVLHPGCSFPPESEPGPQFMWALGSDHESRVVGSYPNHGTQGALDAGKK